MKGGGEDEVGSFGGEEGKKEILKIATLKRACTPQGIYVISSEGLPRILERSPGYAGGYLTLCIRALFRYGVYGVSSSERNVVGLRSREISRDFWRATDVQGVGRITLFGYSIMRCTNEKSSSLKFFELK